MKTQQIETFVVPVLPSKQVEDSTWKLDTMGYTIVKVTTDDGITGIGWTYDVGGAAIRSIIESYIAPIVSGRSPFETETIWQDCVSRLRGVGRKGLTFCALSIVDIALWDIKAKSVGLPLYRLLGGSESNIPIYGSGGWTSYDRNELVKEVTEIASIGYRRIKIKVGVEKGQRPQEDVERVRLVRKELGHDIDLMIDANNAWDPITAMRVAHGVENCGLYFFEEPVIADDLTGLASLRARTRVPIATGEHEYTKYGARDLIVNKAADVIQMDASKCGGITEWLKIAAIAQAWNLPVAPHAMHALHMHLVSAAPNGVTLEYLFMHEEANEQLFINPPVPAGGFLRIPDKPGLGLELNEVSVRKLDVK